MHFQGPGGEIKRQQQPSSPDPQETRSSSTAHGGTEQNHKVLSARAERAIASTAIIAANDGTQPLDYTRRNFPDACVMTNSLLAWTPNLGKDRTARRECTTPPGVVQRNCPISHPQFIVQ